MKHKHVLLPLTSSLTCASDTSEQYSQDSKKTLVSVEKLENQIQENSDDDTDDVGGTVKKNGWSHFSEVFMVSALTGDGMDSIRVNSISLWLVGCDESCSNKCY